MITNLSTNEKLGRQDPKLLPKASFLDPTNTFTVSPGKPLSGGPQVFPLA